MKKNILIIFLISFSALANECIEGDCSNGKGTLLTSTGDKYVGEWSDTTFQGGMFISADGKSYSIGCTEGDCNDGYGTYFWHNETSYVGEWKEGIQHGEGKLTYEVCGYYEGEWKDGKKEGHGIEFDCGGGVYEGEFINNDYNGKGAFYFSCCCGDTSETNYKGHQYCNHYDGEFKDGKFHGHGKFTIMGTETTEGEWLDGILKK